MIVLFTDFGWVGPYVGQMKARVLADVPGVAVVDLMHDVPAFDVKGAAYLLAAYGQPFPEQAVFLCVVDPGVGSARRALAVQVGARWYVGPDNGLFEIVIRRARNAGVAVTVFEIVWQPDTLSASFHGRDLFAPMAARLALGTEPSSYPEVFQPRDEAGVRRLDWPDDWDRVLHLDGYGNAITGIRASILPEDATLALEGHVLARARTFDDVPPGQGFWYENANGLVEIAVNQGHAGEVLGAHPGSQVRVTKL